MEQLYVVSKKFCKTWHCKIEIGRRQYKKEQQHQERTTTRKNNNTKKEKQHQERTTTTRKMSETKRRAKGKEEKEENPKGRGPKKTLKEQMGEEEWLRFKEFKKSMTKFICTTRFTDFTWQENVKYKKRIFKNSESKCIYGSPFTLRQQIAPDVIVFVLEMNNDQNKMMGVGLIRNHPICGKHKIYENGNYNRYAFVGATRISREEMTPDEEKIMKAFDILCFKGSKHMKRGNGINMFPAEILFRCMSTVNLVEFVSGMFKRRMTKTKK